MDKSKDYDTTVLFILLLYIIISTIQLYMMLQILYGLTHFEILAILCTDFKLKLLAEFRKSKEVKPYWMKLPKTSLNVFEW